jgi:hypothetical protein
MALESHNSQRSADWDIIRAAYRVLANVSDLTLAWAQRRGSASGLRRLTRFLSDTRWRANYHAELDVSTTEPHTTAATPNSRAASHTRGGTATSPGDTRMKPLTTKPEPRIMRG